MMTPGDRQHLPPAAKAGEPPPPAELGETASIKPDTPSSPSRSASHSTQAETWLGKTLGKYQVTGVLGEGGMGVVLKARDPMIDRDVAIKVLAGHLADDAAASGRFLAEARAAGKLNHPNVTAVYDIFQEGQTYYLVLEYVPGGSLDDLLAGRPCSVLEATNALIDACKGVGAAHAAGLIHRDIKPANFMRASDGSIKVADFGLAKVAAETGRHFTHTGAVVGTPFFMSPEQCEARPLDNRSDVYSLGATYYSLLTGRFPYDETENIPQVMFLHCHGPVPDPRAVNPGVPEACSRIVARAMAKAPAERYQSAGDMLADLQALAAALSGPARIALPSDVLPKLDAAPPAPPASGGRRLRLAVAGLMLVALLGAAMFVWRPWQTARHDAADAVPAVAATGEAVKVGVLHSLSGTMSISGTAVTDATLFAIDELNHSGGVLGRPVEAVVVDGRSDWPAFAAEAERLITHDKVCTIFGCWTSSARKAVKPVVEAHDHLLVYPVQYEGLETSPCIFYLGAAPNQQMLPAVEWAMATLHAKRFFLVGSDYVFSRAANAIIKDRLGRSPVEVVGEEYVPFGAENVEAAVAAISRAKPDLILNTINGDSNTAFFRALRAAGVAPVRVPTLSFSVGKSELRSLNPATLEGDYAAWTYFQSVDTPENQEFVRRFHEKNPQQDITDPMATAYVCVKLWAGAVTEAQSLEPKKVRRALLNQRLKGPFGEVRIDPDTQHCYRTPMIGQIQADRHFQIVWTGPEPIRPEPYPTSRTAEAWGVFLHDLYTGWGNRWAAPAANPAPK
jgi:urea transport system substrate-binding protein